MKSKLEKKSYTGSCLCGIVQFQFEYSMIKTFYRCYCSLCRKQSGAASNTATLIQAQLFHWVNGQQQIQTYKKDTGFTSSFCDRCGSPVPNPLGSNPKIMWIPLGLLQEDFIPEQELHFCMSSQTSWASFNKLSMTYDELPSGTELQNFFELHL
ncbi:S-(hydroxymethyl)glutathione synthase [Acinetobacter guerrae]|uniref:S-(Hydroxymethyl)glutathione synthase n=1 Tax=Acinetobacter guerrae TaxID=1843371 RepID=A0A3A8EJ03_9GAMM|nr:GFA family protein [Acinetobacter guerrae]RKG34902.1 S-(hydroxymethyl)glutathione synthase [Acinetobacter guerrae]